jgi:hypothetical protein
MPAENAPHAHAEEHVAELRNRGVREDLLDIVLRQADGGGEERRRDADDRDTSMAAGRVHEDGPRARTSCRRRP